jgi:predicted RNA-binding Zn ribbon-like protein
MELLQSYEDLVEWATQAGALSTAQRSVLLREAESHPKEATATHTQAIELRESLYRIMSAIVKNRRPADEDLRTVSAYLAEALSHLELQPARRGFRLQWPANSTHLDSVLWAIVRSASDLLTGNDLPYVRECGDDTCRWVFVDRSKNHSRRWCDMKICGNRMKARKFYRRQSRAGRRPVTAT